MVDRGIAITVNVEVHDWVVRHGILLNVGVTLIAVATLLSKDLPRWGRILNAVCAVLSWLFFALS